MRPFLTRWFCTTAAVAVAVGITGMQADTPWALIGMALFLGILNALVRPVLLMLSLPFIVATLGLFILIVNTGILAMAAGLVPGFHVNGFWNALFGAVIVSAVSWGLSLFFRDSQGRYHVITHHPEMKQVRGREVET